ncbi:MAG TPA: hypothetical protein VKA04_07290 [Pseudodesulfovibrio sp.]|nr:hypothetical protein [Pseudodesulfovibrio sp.]
MDIILKLLDWPVLLFVGLGLLVMNFGEEIRELIKRGGVTVSWGTGSISIEKFADRMDRDFGILNDDLEMLRDQFSTLAARPRTQFAGIVNLPEGFRTAVSRGGGDLLGGRATGFSGAGRSVILDHKGRLGGEADDPDEAEEKNGEAALSDAKMSDEEVRLRMLEALNERKFHWRSVERIAFLAGVRSTRASGLLRDMKEVDLDMEDEGRAVARLLPR